MGDVLYNLIQEKKQINICILTCIEKKSYFQMNEIYSLIYHETSSISIHIFILYDFWSLTSDVFFK